MSGGSYDYAYEKVDRFIDTLRESISEGLPFDKDDFISNIDFDARFMFAKHLECVSKAMRAIEWVDSGDSAEGSEVQAIRACLNIKNAEN